MLVVRFWTRKELTPHFVSIVMIVATCLFIAGYATTVSHVFSALEANRDAGAGADIALADTVGSRCLDPRRRDTS